jgi:hypothetical protein
VKPLILRLLGRPEVSPTTPPPQTFRMWPVCHRRPSLAWRFQSRTIATVASPHVTRRTMAITSSS